MKSAASHTWHYSAVVFHCGTLCKNCYVRGDSPMANGRFMVSKMWLLMASTTTEPSVNEDQ
jgi:hypothetical protein